jgi:GNAT superfamily N-acetyltransferase
VTTPHNIAIIPVAATPRALRRFVLFQWRIFRGDRLWVPPLVASQVARLDPSRGKWFEQGLAAYYAAYRDGHMVGTICCAVDHTLNQATGAKNAVFGYNHYLPDNAVAAALWDHAAAWARRRGLERLMGPFDLDYEDAYGVLIEGYDRQPALLCGHSPPYYREFVERYGFEPAREQNVALEIPVPDDPSEVDSFARLEALAQRVRARGRIRVRPANPTDWDGEIDRILALLNRSLAVLPDFMPWTRPRLESLVEEMEPWIDPELALFAEIEGQPVGLALALPNLNEILARLNGLRHPWDQLRAPLVARRRPTSFCLKSLVVDPAHWASGVDALLFHAMYQRARQRGYRWADLSITGAENPMTVRLATRMGARIYKRWQVYALPLVEGVLARYGA